MAAGPRIAGFVSAASVLVADQITKALALRSLEGGGVLRLVDPYLMLRLRYNSGAAFSLRWAGPVFLSIFTGIAAGAVAWFLATRPPASRLQACFFGLIMGGAVGNLVDRLLHSGFVVDFIDMGTAGWRWPTYNVADAAIVVGALGLLLFGRKGGKAVG
jgi:signal peptidase II